MAVQISFTLDGEDRDLSVSEVGEIIDQAFVLGNNRLIIGGMGGMVLTVRTDSYQASEMDPAKRRK